MIKLYFSLTVKDQNGKVRKKITKRISHSFTKQFLQYFEAMAMHRFSAAENGCAMQDTGNVSRTMGTAAWLVYYSYGLLGAQNSSSAGIVVGTGTNAESVSNYALQTQCTHGIGANQLQHSQQTYSTSIVVGTDVFLSTLRTFQNGSGSTITINEIGLYVASYEQATSTVRYICIVRDLLAAGVDILNSEICTVQYTFKTTN